MNSLWAMILPSAVNTYNLIILRNFFLQTRQHAWQERREFTDEQGKAEKNQGFCRQQDF